MLQTKSDPRLYQQETPHVFSSTPTQRAPSKSLPYEFSLASIRSFLL